MWMGEGVADAAEIKFERQCFTGVLDELAADFRATNRA